MYFFKQFQNISAIKRIIKLYKRVNNHIKSILERKIQHKPEIKH